eukprot:14996-Heterococcus_DN1.PRE.3
MYSSTSPAMNTRTSGEAAAATHQSAAQKLLLVPSADEFKRDKSIMMSSSLKDNGAAMADRLTSKPPHTFNAVAVRTCSPAHSPAAKKLRVSQCFQSAHQAACIDGKQQDLELLQHAAEITAVHCDRHGIIQDQGHRCDKLAASLVYQMRKDTHGLSNSSYHHAVASTITAEHCEHSAMLPQNTVSKIDSCTATESSLDAVMAEATLAFSTIDCATDALLVITALLVNWQDQATAESVQKVCYVLQMCCKRQ